MTPFDLGAVALAISGLVTVLVQLVKALFIDPNMRDTPRRAALLQLITYLLNTGLLILAAVLTGAFRPADLLVYILFGFGQSAVSGGIYQLNKAGANPLPQQAPGPDHAPAESGV